MWLTPNYYSRPQYKNIPEFVVIHWVGVANATLTGVFNYFEDRKNGKNSYGSAHSMISGELIGRFIPDNEMAYAVGSNHYTDYKYEIMQDAYPNSNTYNIEVRVEDLEGNMDELTYETLIEYTKDLLEHYGLDISKVLLHGEITGKDCHKLFMNNSELWAEFKDEVNERLGNKMEILTTEQNFDFLGRKIILDVKNIDDHVYISAENLREMGLKVKWIEETNTVVVSL